MKKIMATVGFVFVLLQASANINYIDATQIGNEPKFQSAFDYLRQNQHIYDQWSAEWKFDKPKEGFVKTLRSDYVLFSSVKKKNEELFLLLGDIAH